MAEKILNVYFFCFLFLNYSFLLFSQHCDNNNNEILSQNNNKTINNSENNNFNNNFNNLTHSNNSNDSNNNFTNSNFNELISCYNSHQICYKICGILKNYCDEDLKYCLNKKCELENGIENWRNCDNTINLYLLNLDVNGKIEEFHTLQNQYCVCIDKTKLQNHYLEIFQEFYSRNAPEKISKSIQIIKNQKDQTQSMYAKYLYELHKKYQSTIINIIPTSS